MNLLRNVSKEKLWDYAILVARFLIGFTFLRYGYSKLTEGQFGISEDELIMPLKEISLFKLSWYLFDHQPFKMFIGISQIICGVLLVINRTVLLGAFMFLPIVSTILVIDFTFMPPTLAKGFTWRLSFYIFLDLMILWHYKNRMLTIWQAVYQGISTKFRFPIWAYLILPIMAIGLEIVGIIPRIITGLIVNDENT